RRRVSAGAYLPGEERGRRQARVLRQQSEVNAFRREQRQYLGEILLHPTGDCESVVRDEQTHCLPSGQGVTRVVGDDAVHRHWPPESLDDPEFVIDEPSWEDPGPAILVGSWPSVCQALDDSAGERRVELKRRPKASKPDLGVKREWVPLREVVEGSVGEGPHVGGVTPAVGAGEMGYGEPQDRSRSTDSMDFLHEANDIIEIFQNVVAQDLLEGVVSKWPGPPGEIMQALGVRSRAAIKIHCPRYRTRPGPKVEHTPLRLMRAIVGGRLVRNHRHRLLSGDTRASTS